MAKRGSTNYPWLYITADKILISIHHSDRRLTNYLVHDTNENIIEYLHREQIVDELLLYFL